MRLAWALRPSVPQLLHAWVLPPLLASAPPASLALLLPYALPVSFSFALVRALLLLQVPAPPAVHLLPLLLLLLVLPLPFLLQLLLLLPPPRPPLPLLPLLLHVAAVLTKPLPVEVQLCSSASWQRQQLLFSARPGAVEPALALPAALLALALLAALLALALPAAPMVLALVLLLLPGAALDARQLSSGRARAS